MFATFQPDGDVIHVKLAARPVSEADFNIFLADWLACYQRRGGQHASFIFVVDARALSWQVWALSYLVRLQAFINDLHASRCAYPETYDRLERCYVATEGTCTHWTLRLLCAWQPPVSPVYLVATPERALDLERLRALGLPINPYTAPDTVCMGMESNERGGAHKDAA